MFKRFLAVIAGMLSSFLIVFIVDSLVPKFFAIEAVDPKDMDAIKAIMSRIPTAALVTMVAGWLLSAFVGGFVCGSVDKINWKVNSIILAIVLLLGVVMNFVAIPHPIWMMAVAVIMYIPCSYIGAKLAASRNN
jgi:hypothetical protein